MPTLNKKQTVEFKVTKEDVEHMILEYYTSRGFIPNGQIVFEEPYSNPLTKNATVAKFDCTIELNNKYRQIAEKD